MTATISLCCPNVAADCGASGAATVLDVAIKARLPSADPIGSSIVINLRARAHEAEEDVPRRSDDNSCVPMPHDQIAGLRLHDASKLVRLHRRDRRSSHNVGEAGALVNGVNQVRAVVAGIAAHFGIERGGDHGQTVVRSQCPVGCCARDSCSMRAGALDESRLGGRLLRGCRHTEPARKTGPRCMGLGRIRIGLF